VSCLQSYSEYLTIFLETVFKERLLDGASSWRSTTSPPSVLFVTRLRTFQFARTKPLPSTHAVPHQQKHVGLASRLTRRRVRTTTTSNSRDRIHRSGLQFTTTHFPAPPRVTTMAAPTFHFVNDRQPATATAIARSATTSSTIDNRLLPPPLRAVPQLRQRSTSGYCRRAVPQLRQRVCYGFAMPSSISATQTRIDTRLLPP